MGCIVSKLFLDLYFFFYIYKAPKWHVERLRLKKEDVLDRTKWKRDIHNHSGDPR